MPAGQMHTTVGSPINALTNNELIDDLRTLSTVLLHEFMHIFGGPNSMSASSVSPLNARGVHFGI